MTQKELLEKWRDVAGEQHDGRNGGLASVAVEGLEETKNSTIEFRYNGPDDDEEVPLVTIVEGNNLVRRGRAMNDVYDIYRVFESNTIEGLRVTGLDELMLRLSATLQTLVRNDTSLKEIKVVKVSGSQQHLFTCSHSVRALDSRCIVWKELIDGQQILEIVTCTADDYKAALDRLADSLKEGPSTLKLVQVYDIQTGKLLLGRHICG